jgi:RNA polymerase sigma-70 factor (ECF subfamily)
MNLQPPSDESQDFDSFMERIRRGDAAAAEELVRRYEPLIRREVRMNLRDPRLGRLFDSMDVCQSVMASFFIRAAAGQFDLRKRSQLVSLLVEMAQHKLASAARQQYRQRRDTRRLSRRAEDAVGRAATAGPGPSEIVAGEELLNRFRQCLSAEERQLADWRSDGIPWAEIASRLGGTPGSRRLQLLRAVNRATREMGLDD